MLCQHGCQFSGSIALSRSHRHLEDHITSSLLQLESHLVNQLKPTTPSNSSKAPQPLSSSTVVARRTAPFQAAFIPDPFGEDLELPTLRPARPGHNFLLDDDSELDDVWLGKSKQHLQKQHRSPRSPKYDDASSIELPSRELSYSPYTSIGRRVCKACDRCRLKKSKVRFLCGGEHAG